MTDEEASDLTLDEILAAAALDLPGVATDQDGAATIWSAAGSVFATLMGERAEFRLDPLVARAALRTPDTAPSSRGADWIRFNPQELDGHALDRLRAWLELGYRRAGE